MKKLFSSYFAIPLVYRVVAAFLTGILTGILLWHFSGSGSALWFEPTIQAISPFGTILVSMLKMAVVPVIFFSLVTGAASLPMNRFGQMGIFVLAWYFITSLFAGAFGTVLAMLINPSMTDAGELGGQLLGQADKIRMGGASGGALQMLNDLFMNPFQALAEGKFLPIIVFSILFGLAARSVLDRCDTESGSAAVQRVFELFDVMLKISFRIIDWVMGYFPVGVFALTTVNFALYGVELFGPYLQIAGCVITGILIMILVIYPALIAIFCRENPYRLLYRIKEPIITAFVTRSSAAALPVSLATARKLGIQNQLSGFALPLGATINMDGVCIHLPVFAILAANIFGIELGIQQLIILVISVVFASVGAGGIPGGSIFLLFMVLENMGLSPNQVSLVVALAIGINPLMDMFETACNVAGDNAGNYIIGKKLKMISATPEDNLAAESPR
jgi:Na+/H+-dicarboxylate symporter